MTEISDLLMYYDKKLKGKVERKRRRTAKNKHRKREKIQKQITLPMALAAKLLN